MDAQMLWKAVRILVEEQDILTRALLDLHERLGAVEQRGWLPPLPPGVEHVDVAGPARRYTAPGFAIPVEERSEPAAAGESAAPCPAAQDMPACTATDAAAAEAELHSLRAQLAGYQRGAAAAREHYATATLEQMQAYCEALNGEAVRMATDYAQLGGRHADLSDSLRGCLGAAAEAERAAVVAWLRGQAGDRSTLVGAHAAAYSSAANAIESGDHLKESR